MVQIIDPMWDDNPIDVSKEVNFIWSIANKLRGPYTSEEYKDVIIPMTILRRFECALAPTKAAVVAQYAKNPNYPEKAMQRLSGYQFYNTSKYDLTELCNDADNIVENLKAYIEGFSSNVKGIFDNLEFYNEIIKMNRGHRLYVVVKAFSELDLDPKKIDGMMMGYIFEELIRKFSENAEAGDHYTGRDIIKTMVAILLSEGSEDVLLPGREITILDQACGTGGMLSTSFNFIRRFNPDASIRLFGHEINDKSYAMCLAEMLIKGQDVDNIRHQDTMKADAFPNIKMRYVIENPPFGQAWGGKDAGVGVEEAVKKEFNNGFNGRWGAGLPGTGDMQMLFLQSAIDKLRPDNGRAAIIEDGSPLFVGGTASGESQIRRWFLENDYIEAIIALPTDLFYNTGIATYIWILSMNKRPERVGKIQLIDASSICHKLRKPLGNKKNEIGPEERKRIVDLYLNFEENELCKIYPNTEFIYREYSVMQPLQRSYAINDERIENLLLAGALNSLYDAAKIAEIEEKEEPTEKELAKLEDYKAGEPKYNNILSALREHSSDTVYLSQTEFEPVLEQALNGIVARKDKLFDAIVEGLSVMDKAAEIHRDKKGNIIYDKETKDIEIVRFDETIEDYMQREVLPHIPDAQWFFEEDMSKKKPVIKTGAEIPFTRYFYKYQKPTDSKELKEQFIELEKSIATRIANIFD